MAVHTRVSFASEVQFLVKPMGAELRQVICKQDEGVELLLPDVAARHDGDCKLRRTPSLCSFTSKAGYTAVLLCPVPGFFPWRVDLDKGVVAIEDAEGFFLHLLTCAEDSEIEGTCYMVVVLLEMLLQDVAVDVLAKL